MTGPVIALVTQAVGRLLEQAQAKTVFAGFGGFGDADKQRRVLVGVQFFVAGGDEATDPATAIHVHTQRLRGAHHDIGAEINRCGQHAEGDRIDADDDFGTHGMGNGGNLGALLFNHAEIRRCFEIDRRRLRTDRGAQVIKIEQAGFRVEVDESHDDVARHFHGFAVIADDGQSLRIDGAHYRHFAAPGNAGCHANGVARSAAPTAHRQTDQVHVQQLAELAAELEPGLIATVVGARLAKHRGQPFVAAHDLVARCRNVMLPTAGAQEVEVSLARLVLRQRADQVPTQFALVERGRQINRTLQAVFIGNLLEQFLDAADTDRVEHLLFERRNRVRHVGVGDMITHGVILIFFRMKQLIRIEP
ncbi:hypothetical protein D3C85_952160 [compost metagenome]